MQLHHGLLFLQLAQSPRTNGCTAPIMRTSALTADDFQQPILHSVQPPQFLVVPAFADASAPHLAALCSSYIYSLRQKNGFAKSVWAISPLCFQPAKNISNFLCSLDRHSLSKYDLFGRLHSFQSIMLPAWSAPPSKPAPPATAAAAHSRSGCRCARPRHRPAAVPAHSGQTRW